MKKHLQLIKNINKKAFEELLEISKENLGPS